jgi:hypothetical protein
MGSMDGQQIYDTFHNHANGAQGLSTAGQTAGRLAAKYVDHAVTTQQMINGTRSGWQGKAAEASLHGLAPFAENALNYHQQLNTGQDIVSRQVDSFHTLVSEVRPVPPAPQMQNVITAIMSGQDPKPMIAQIVAHQAIQQSNVDAYNKYVGASQYNTSNLPLMTTALSTQSAPIAAVAPPPAPSGTATAASTTRTPQVAGGGLPMESVLPSGGTPRSAAPTIAGGGSLSSVGPVSSVPTTIANAAPPSVPSPPVVAPPSNGPAAGSSPDPVRPVEPILPVGGIGQVEGGVPGKGVGSGSGIRGGAGEIGSGGARSGSGSSLVGGQPKAGVRSGSAAVDRGAVPGGSPSTAAGPMTGKRDEDAEHRRKYDYDEDPDELFAATERVAPPVLGETAVEREARYADDADRHHSED